MKNTIVEVPIICRACLGGGLNHASQAIRNDFIGDRDGKNGWQHSLTQEEVQILWDNNRLQFDFEKLPTANEVNKWSHEDRIGHDTINRNLLVKFRAEKAGVYGMCENCNGEGEALSVAKDLINMDPAYPGNTTDNYQF